MMLRRIAFAVALPVALLATVALATAASSRSTAKVGSAAAGATVSKCGAGTGKKASGAPIKLGGIAMLIPGVDFTTIGKFAKAYYDCVNDNGGIRGRPISYKLYTEQLNPAQEASLARKLIESDKVVGVTGNTSFAECGVNWKYYKSKGYTVIGAGVQAECFGTPTFVETNMGPRYSNIGAAQALVRAGIKKLAIASPDSVAAYSDGGAVKVAQAAGIPVKTFPTKLPVTDATSQLLQMYQFVGDGGGILLNFTPDTAPAFMKAAIAQGLVSKVKWGSSTPIANTFMSEQFSRRSTDTCGSTASSVSSMRRRAPTPA
jgi:branched-chain amino acid transport system substrate-binding protein